jgi:hypothetical protein
MDALACALPPSPPTCRLRAEPGEALEALLPGSQLVALGEALAGRLAERPAGQYAVAWLAGRLAPGPVADAATGVRAAGRA